MNSVQSPSEAPCTSFQTRGWNTHCFVVNWGFLNWKCSRPMNLQQLQQCSPPHTLCSHTNTLFKNKQTTKKLYISPLLNFSYQLYLCPRRVNPVSLRPTKWTRRSEVKPRPRLPGARRRRRGRAAAVKEKEEWEEEEEARHLSTTKGINVWKSWAEMLSDQKPPHQQRRSASVWAVWILLSEMSRNHQHSDRETVGRLPRLKDSGQTSEKKKDLRENSWVLWEELWSVPAYIHTRTLAYTHSPMHQETYRAALNPSQKFQKDWKTEWEWWRRGLRRSAAGWMWLKKRLSHSQRPVFATWFLINDVDAAKKQVKSGLLELSLAQFGGN